MCLALSLFCLSVLCARASPCTTKSWGALEVTHLKNQMTRRLLGRSDIGECSGCGAAGSRRSGRWAADDRASSALTTKAGLGAQAMISLLSMGFRERLKGSGMSGAAPSDSAGNECARVAAMAQLRQAVSTKGVGERTGRVGSWSVCVWSAYGGLARRAGVQFMSGRLPVDRQVLCDTLLEQEKWVVARS